MNQQHIHSKDIQLSKSLSWLLRHGAEKEGLTFDDGGFIDVQKILSLKQFNKFTVDDIKRVVNNNDKQRFTLRMKKDTNLLQIRANQGHTLPVEEKDLLTLLNDRDVPSLVYHGTYISKIDSIKKRGLSRMKRNHIHFTTVLPGEDDAISGVRKNCEVVIVVDTIKAMKDGIKFYISDNGVILSPGNETGVIFDKYFKEIFQLSTNTMK